MILKSGAFRASAVFDSDGVSEDYALNHRATPNTMVNAPCNVVHISPGSSATYVCKRTNAVVTRGDIYCRDASISFRNCINAAAIVASTLTLAPRAAFAADKDAHEDRVEMRVKNMHNKLKITPA